MSVGGAVKIIVVIGAEADSTMTPQTCGAWPRQCHWSAHVY